MIDYINPVLGMSISALLWLILFVMILLEVRARRRLEREVNATPRLYMRDANGGWRLLPAVHSRVQELFDQADYDNDEEVK